MAVQTDKLIYIVIPAKDEGERVGPVITECIAQGFKNIILVNDGSTDNTKEVGENAGAIVLNHKINLGAGAATQTGITEALRRGADIIVTIDADHQHFPEDIPLLIQKLEKKQADIVIGSRFLNKENQVPLLRRLFNQVGNIINFLITGLWVTDSQSGMKAINAEFAQEAEIKEDGFEFCIELIRYASHHDFDLEEVPIKVRYTADTLSKGQGFFMGLKMLARLRKYI